MLMCAVFNVYLNLAAQRVEDNKILTEGAVLQQPSSTQEEVTVLDTEAIAKNTLQQPYTKEGTVEITVEGSPVQQVNDFAYLGVIVSSGGTIDPELSARIRKASGAFNQLKYIWKNRNI